jgi:U3 small nucleolar RNA-associated protein 12
VKYWDADKFEQLLELPGHQGPVWGLAVSHLGDLVVSCGGDRAIRR